MNKYLDNKGIFSISYDFIKEIDFDKISKIFSDVIIINAENDFITNQITYRAISHKFKKVTPHEIVPIYECIIHEINDQRKNIEIEWKMIGAI